MQTTFKVIHLLALGLWFGSITFFSFFAALPIIRRLQQLGESQPEWLAGLENAKQGTRLAGEALAPVFARYFPLQVLCGALALLTAFTWINVPGSVHKLRLALVGAALVLACANTWWLAPRVSELRNQRYSNDMAVAERAEKEFGAWHSYSLITDMATLLLVAIALSLAAALPDTAGLRNEPVATPPASAGHSQGPSS